MTKHTIELDIPDGWEIRNAEENRDERVFLIRSDSDFGKLEVHHTILLKKSWDPPKAAIKSGSWVAKELNGSWYLYKEKPTIGNYGWDGDEYIFLNPAIFDWTPPENIDWKESLRQIP